MRSWADSEPKLGWVTEGQRVGVSAAAIDALIDEYRPGVAIAPDDFPIDVADAVFVGIRGPERETRAVSRQ
jgi:hypothetical protein